MRTFTIPGRALASMILAIALTGAAQADVTIGVAGPMTGTNAAIGDQFKEGVEQAVADINAAGGVLGQKFVVSVADDRADPKEGVSVANRFAANGVKFIVGPANSGVVMAASEVYQENGILTILPASTNPEITERNMWNIFRVCGRDDVQGSVAGRIIADKFRGKRIAFVHDKTTYGQGLANETRKAINAKGMTEVLFEGVNRDDRDFNALISKIKSVNADLVYVGAPYDIAGLIVRQMRDQGVKAPVMSGDAVASSEFASIGGPGAEGTLMTYFPDARNNPGNEKIIEAFRKKGYDPQGYTLYSYASVQIIKQAAEQAKSLDPKKVADVMHSGKVFNTVLGGLSFDRKGDVSGGGYMVAGKKKDRYVLYVWKKTPDGKLTYFESE